MSELRSWNDTETTEAIVAFAEGAAQTVPPEERIAVFDNDGTLWCEKLRHLEAHGFTCFIAAGGSRDFMRTVTGEVYGIPPERVVGSSFGLEYVDDEHGGSLAYLAQPDVFVHDDPAREFDYVKGAETALDRARHEGWTVVSVKDDWATVFA